MNKKEVSAYFKALGKVGGKKRWKGKSKAVIKLHMQKMAKLSHAKRYPQKTLKKEENSLTA